MSGAVAKMRKTINQGKPKVTVNLMGEDGKGEMTYGRKKGDTWFQVSVYSVAREGLMAERSVETNAPNLLQEIMATAGSCAEYLCDRYDGSFLDPSDCAKEAGIQFKRLEAKLNSAGKGS